MWVKSKEIRNVLNITRQCLYAKEKSGKVITKKINGTKFYFLEKEEEFNKYNVVYCRVSNTKQKTDLVKQEKLLVEYAISNGYKIDYVFKDIASGMNEDRNDFNKLLILVFDKQVNKIFISYKDRLTRFGYNYFENIFKKFNTKIEIVNLTKEEDFQDELTHDFISIIHHFSMKMYSSRRKDLKLLENKLKSDNTKVSI